MSNELESSLALLLSGRAPESLSLLEQMSVGLEPLMEFWKTRYLDDYISQGGGRVQCLSGRSGSGKTHLLRLFFGRALGFKKVYFSARQIWLNDFKEIFFEILRQCDISDCLQACASKIIEDMGYSPESIPRGANFTAYLSDIGENTSLNKRELRRKLDELFLRNPLLDNNFALAMALLTGGLLGHPILEEPSKEALLGWLHGDKTVRLAAIRRLGLSPSRITKYNARHMLRSLGELIRMAGYRGLLVAIDDMEILVGDDSLEPIRYTKVRRTDAYESIREIIDEIDTLPHMWFFFVFDRKLIDDENLGLKSYLALWMRLQNEVNGERPNLFSSMLDLERLSLFDSETVMLLAQKLSVLMHAHDCPVRPFDIKKADELIEQSAYAGIALPRLVVQEVCGKAVAV